jgi:hypothetical protein
MRQLTADNRLLQRLGTSASRIDFQNDRGYVVAFMKFYDATQESTKTVDLDADLISLLGNLSKEFELCDPQGQPIAIVRPSTPDTDPEHWYPFDEAPTSSNPRIDVNRTYTTAEVLELLKSVI